MPQINAKGEIKKRPIISIHAPGGFGKTRAAATASKYFVTQDPVTKMVHLGDVLWLQFDVDGLSSLHSVGLDPDYHDFSDQPIDAPLYLAKVLQQLKDIAKAPTTAGYYCVVVDTLTTLSRYLETYYLAKEKDARLAYGRAGNDFRNFLLHLRAIPLRQVWLMHTKAFVEAVSTDAESEKNKQNTLLPGDYRLKLGLTYALADTVRTMSSLIVGVDVDDRTGKRSLITKSDGLYETKNRYDGIIKDREAVNLRDIFERIDTHIENLEGDSK